MISQNKQVSADVINILEAYKTNQIKTQTNSPGKKAAKWEKKKKKKPTEKLRKTSEVLHDSSIVV